MCKEDKIIVEHVDTIKNKVDLLTGESSDLETLDEIIIVCKSGKQKIESNTICYYIAFVEEIVDFYNVINNKYYIPIGKADKNHAKKLAKKYCKKLHGNYYNLIEVSKETYNIYNSIAKLDNVLMNLYYMTYSSRGRDYILEDSIRKEQDDLRKKIGRIKTCEHIIDKNQV